METVVLKSLALSCCPSLGLLQTSTASLILCLELDNLQDWALRVWASPSLPVFGPFMRRGVWASIRNCDMTQDVFLWFEYITWNEWTFFHYVFYFSLSSFYRSDGGCFTRNILYFRSCPTLPFCLTPHTLDRYFQISWSLFFVQGVWNIMHFIFC